MQPTQEKAPLAHREAARNLCYALRDLGLPTTGPVDSKARDLILAAFAKLAPAAPLAAVGAPAATDGASLIAAERLEQVVKHGWDLAHDADYGRGELVQAAATCLSLYATGPMADIAVGGEYNQRKMWPWQSEFGMGFYAKIWAKDAVGKLKVAGALIAAEIDRLQGTQPTPAAASVTLVGGPPALGDAELAKLVQLERDVTPAPWFVHSEPEGDETGLTGWHTSLVPQAGSFTDEAGTYNDIATIGGEDGDFIAAMRNALPGLLARLQAAEAPSAAGVPAGPLGGQEWIAVSDRLPEPGVDVLVCSHRDDCPICIAQYLPDEVDEDDEDKWEYGYGVWLHPYFWCPLPAQPTQMQAELCAKLFGATPKEGESRASQEGGRRE